MDPYLEGSLWTAVHSELSVEIRRQLAPRLRPRYLALTNERYVLDLPEATPEIPGSIYPNVAVTDTARGSLPSPGGGSLTVPLRLVTVMPPSRIQLTVEIRDTANRQLVTAIEVLSPTNKRGEGRGEYLAKRHGLLLSTAHLLEIDFLRQGHRVPMGQALPSVPYFVFLSRAESRGEEGRPIAEVWPITFHDPLPVVAVPLLPGDPDVPLDLQQALTAVYDSVGFDLAVDYTQPPEIPLPSEAAAWADERLRAAGLRP
jgi:hypothetical protein